VCLQIKRIEKLLKEQKIRIKLTDSALDYIVSSSYDPVYGARPLKRAIQRELENPMATRILENRFVCGDQVIVDCHNNNLKFCKKQSEEDIVQVKSKSMFSQGS
jgi:ATP-dependent Clp protease ATP-binding subunit ClpB